VAIVRRASYGRNEPAEPFAAQGVEAVTDEVVLRALAALDEMSLRELEVAGERLLLRRDGLQAFGRVFADVANERDGGFGQSRYHLSEALEGADDRLLEQIEHAEAPFWAHVRDALAERHP
jgi:hypothetical protein